MDNELDRSTTVERRPNNCQMLNIPISAEKENNVGTIISLIDAHALMITHLSPIFDTVDSEIFTRILF